jgi:hypothetical protein
MGDTKLDIDISEEDEERIKLFKDTYNALYISHFDNNKLEYVKHHCNPVQVRLINKLKVYPSYDVDL